MRKLSPGLPFKVLQISLCSTLSWQISFFNSGKIHVLQIWKEMGSKLMKVKETPPHFVATEFCFGGDRRGHCKCKGLVWTCSLFERLLLGRSGSSSFTLLALAASGKSLQQTVLRGRNFHIPLQVNGVPICMKQAFEQVSLYHKSF